MAKIKYNDLVKILSSDVVKDNNSIEINFCIDNDTEYEDCWIGKMSDKDDLNKEIYWYGLVPDGSQGYNYSKLEDILNAKVFNCKSMNDVIEKVNWISLDGCSVEEMLVNYIDF